MTTEENEKVEKIETSESQEESGGKKKKPAKKSQSQILQEALGLEPEDIQSIEQKLFLARFTDYFSEQTLDFIYKDKQLNSYKKEVNERFKTLGDRREEDKLLKKGYEDRQIEEILNKLKINGEELARINGIKQPFDKKMRKYSLATTLPMFGLLILLTFLQIGNFYFILFPLLCVFCLVPQIIRGRIMKQWFNFKQEHKNEFYTQNREDLMILKGFTADVLANIRSSLLEMKIPLQLIKFVLYSRDYENLNLITQKQIKGGKQYYFHCEYPEGMEPFPIPDALKQQYQEQPTRTQQAPEKNFIVLSEIKSKEGVINSFVPTLKDNLADEINEILNNSEFTKPDKEFNEIIPEYSEDLAIYCKCGEMTKIDNVNIGNWKDQFKFYLFEGTICDCGESVYALSKMDEDTKVPDELKDIFND